MVMPQESQKIRGSGPCSAGRGQNAHQFLQEGKRGSGGASHDGAKIFPASAIKYCILLRDAVFLELMAGSAHLSQAIAKQ
eukprot:2266899-Karenia_brevis.AAC.1